MRSQPLGQPAHPLTWRSRSFRGVVTLLVLVLAVRWAWGAYVDHLLRGQLDEIRRRGESAAVGEVVFESVSDAENAWTVQMQAAQAVWASGVLSPRASNHEFPAYPPYSVAWMTRVEASEKANAQAFALARQARGFSRVQFRDRLASPAVNTLLPGLNNARQLADTSCDGALYSQVRGDDVEAIERVLDVFHVGRSLHKDSFIVAHLVGNGIDAVATRTVQVLSPGLRAGDPKVRERVGRLITELRDEEPAWRGFEAALRMERLITADWVDWRARGTWFVRPSADMVVVRAHRNFAIAIEASHSRSQPQALATLSGAVWDEPPVYRLGTWSRGGPPEPMVPRYSRFFLGGSYDYTRYFETQFRAVADRRAAVISLAAQLYRADHGAWPKRLEELVPMYLPALPADPYHDDGRPLGFVVKKGALSGGRDRPLVYFDAGTDDPALVGAEPMYEWQLNPVQGQQRGVPIRQYRDLSRFAPPSTQAVEGDPKKADAPGNQSDEDHPAQ